MVVQGRWLRRVAGIVAAGILFAIVVTEIQLALGIDLLDAPFFHVPLLAVGLAVAAVAFAGFQAAVGTTAGMVAAVIAFGIPVLAFNAMGERPAIPVDFWRGNAGLLMARTMTADRPHAVVLVVTGPKTISGGKADLFSGEAATDVVVARLFGDPRPAFTVAPDKDQPRPVSATGDMRWTWTVTPRQPGPQRLVLQLDTVVKNKGSADTVSNLYRQLLVISVQPPSWYEAGRAWFLGLLGA